MEARVYEAALGSGTNSNSSSSNSKTNDSTSTINFADEDPESYENTRLHDAAKSGNVRKVEEIINGSPNTVLRRNKKLETPLHIASRLGHDEVVSLLIRTESALEQVNKAENTALHEAVCNGHCSTVKLLTGKKPSLASMRNAVGESPLFMALDRKFHQISIHILGLEICNDPQGSFFKGRNGMTAMHAAVIRLSKRNKVVQKLDRLCTELAKRYWIFKRCCDRIKGSPFELILEEEVLPKVLEKRGHGILDERDDFGWLPLHYAAELGHVEIVKLFLTKNINLAYEKDDQEGMSALHIAAKKGWIGLLKVLVNHCPDVCELLDNKNRTALHVAVECGKKDAVKTLLDMLDFNDLINDQDGEGNTCLHLAALHEHHAILIMLASDQRVQKSVLNNKGMTAADIIKSSMQLSTVDKRFLMSTIKRQGHFKSLESRVIRETKTVHNQTANDEIKQVLHISQQPKLDMKLKAPVIDVDKASSSGSTSAQASSLRSTSASAQENVQERHDIAKPTSAQIKNSYEQNISSNSYEKNISSINLVATIFVSIKFSAAMQMPGGYDGDGMANLREEVGFKIFLIPDSVAFGCAAASMFIHFGVAFFSKLLQVKYSYPIHCVMALTTIFITSSVMAFITGANVVFKHSSSHGGFQVGLPVYVASLSFMIPILYFLLRSLVVAARRLPSVYVVCLVIIRVLVLSLKIAGIIR